ncbi:hypothetical protein AVEN_15286-1 [Araneus ventricosus]|uniref:Uncharacterized protein n=1 Tax=Araneus ventricosus TaxID=182803 RepID=A0A4Y2MLW8_ARAVE|nr:hypothetical protein AVEN_15286-1 [Araneus ventricosus]
MCVKLNPGTFNTNSIPIPFNGREGMRTLDLVFPTTTCASLSLPQPYTVSRIPFTQQRNLPNKGEAAPVEIRDLANNVQISQFPLPSPPVSKEKK